MRKPETKSRLRALPAIFMVGFMLSSAGSAVAQSSALQSVRQANSDFAAGKFRSVVKRLDEAINTGKMRSDIMARALYLRGRAKLATGRPAEAISDLNAAIWLNKLPKREQKSAAAQRRKAYQKAGLKPTLANSKRPKRATTTAASNWSVVVTGNTPKR